MQNELLAEIKELKTLLAKLIGTSDLPAKEQFSIDALDKAAKRFQKLSIERGEWIEDGNIDKFIKHAPYRAGTFIRQEFGFSNFFKRGQTYYYNKKDLVALGKELKERNVDLGRYMQYVEDQAKFKKYLESINEKGKGKKKKKAFQLSYDLKDITTSPVKPPSADIIRKDLKKLKDEFFQYNLADYIDIYKDNHAMTKFIYHYEKYLDPDMKKRCKRWCENFNYANHALELVTKKKETFIPVKEEEMIQL
jgi:hypothetical protein